MPTGRFDIYQGPGGVTAVTHKVRRQILEALGESDRQLPELVELTGKSKPTLSSVHMKELLNQELILEMPHPTDSRRKVYRLNGRRIGSSDLPVEQLRDAVRRYANQAAPGAGIPWKTAVRCLLLGGASAKVLGAQAEALGAAGGPLPEPSTPRGWVQEVSRFLEQEDLVRTATLDLERPALGGRPTEGLEDADPDALAALLGGLLSGMAKRAGIALRFTGTWETDTLRLHPTNR